MSDGSEVDGVVDGGVWRSSGSMRPEGNGAAWKWDTSATPSAEVGLTPEDRVAPSSGHSAMVPLKTNHWLTL